jgi:hypothetical protein
MAGVAQEALALGGGDLQHVGQALGELARGPTLAPLDLLDGRAGVAQPLRERVLGEIEGLATALDPVAEGWGSNTARGHRGGRS